MKNAKSRSIRDNVPFDLSYEYLLSIATDECPIFHTPFEWGVSGLGKGRAKDNCPTLDRIEPHLGYVKGNVAFISYRANRLKDNGTMQEHYDIADWIWSHLYAKPNTIAPVPKRTNLKGIQHTQPGAVLTTRAGEDDDNAHHHCGTISREDLDHRAQASSGDSVGCGSKKMDTSRSLERLEDYGQPEAEIIRLDFGSRYLPD